MQVDCLQYFAFRYQLTGPWHLGRPTPSEQMTVLFGNAGQTAKFGEKYLSFTFMLYGKST
jgi:hypothetical protein